jgi:hypothetical protein
MLNLDPTIIQPTDLLTLFDERDVTASVPYTEEYIIPAPVPGRPDLQYPNGPFVNLREDPLQYLASVPTGVYVRQVPGGNFAETLAPAIGPGQFRVDYLNGTVLFNAADVGKVVAITYYGIGSEVRAEQVNNITYPLVPFYNKLNGIVPDGGTNFTFPGSITITGAITTIPAPGSPLVLGIDSSILLLDRTYAGPVPADIGVEISRGGNPSGASTNPRLVWNEPTKTWSFESTVNGPTGSLNYPLLSIYDKGGVKGTVVNTVQESALVATLGIGDAGLQWFNSTDSQFKGWNGSSIVILG